MKKPDDARGKFRRSLWRLVKTPAFLVFLAFLLSYPWLLSAWIYLFLRSFLLVPGGGLAWFAICIFGLISAASFAHMIWVEVPQRKRQAVLGIRGDPSLWSTVVAVIAFKPTFGPALALSFWGTMQDDIVRPAGKGKVVVQKPDQQLRILLKTLEHKGVLTWMMELDDKS